MMLDQTTSHVTSPERNGLSNIRTALMASSAPVDPVLTYLSYEEFFKEYNLQLLNNILKPALITLSKGVGPYGACSPGSVANSKNPSQTADRIILRRDHAGTVVENLSNLFRNMVRLSLYNDPNEAGSRPPYFSAAACKKMDAVGLPTFVINKSDGTKRYGKPGESVNHEVDPEGLFARTTATLIDRNTPILYLDRAFSESEEDESMVRARARKAESKTRFVCGKSREEALDDSTKLGTDHYKQKVWGHGKTNVRCGFCLTALTPG